MKILFLTHSFPYPPNEGIKLYAYNLIKQLSTKHEIHLLSLTENDKENIDEINKFCKSVNIVRKKIPKSPFLRLYNILFQKNPFCVYQFYSHKFKEKLLHSIDKIKPDIIHFTFVNTSYYKNFISDDMPSVFFLVDAMSMLFYRAMNRENSILKKLYLYAQYKKMKKYENEMMPKFQETILVSPKDREWLIKNNINKELKISVIPYGVDPNYFSPMDVKEDYPSIIFRGIMNFQPNVDAAVYFAKHIFPLVVKEIHNVKYYIVGKNPTGEIKKLGKINQLIIIDDSSEDLRPFMAKSTVNICPMLSGSGLKIKILEAMAMAKPTVATSIAIEGIPDVIDGENILIADTPEEFAEKVILLIKDESLRKKIGENAREFVMKNYTWQKSAEKFENIYKEAISKYGEWIASPLRSSQ